MKRFFINMVLFLLPLLAGYVLLEKRLQKIPNSYNQKKYYIEQQAANIEVLNVGSSHALNGIDPQYFSHTGFNLGNVSQTPYYDDAMVAQYIDKLPKLKLVIIPMSYFTLYRRFEDVEEDWRMDFYYYYWKIKEPKESLFSISKYSLLTIYSPQMVGGFIRRNFNVNLAPQFSCYGFQAQDSVGHLTDELGEIRSRYHARGFTPQNVAYGKQSLEHMIQLLHEKHIEVALVTIPTYEAYYKYNKPEILACNKAVIDELCSKYGCKYYNYQKDPRFAAFDFANCDHLCTAGAMKFSKILDSEVIRPTLH